MAGLKSQQFTNCLSCDRSVFEGGSIHFYEIRTEQHVANIPAIQRRHGLAMMMGGAGALADVMGPNEDLSHGMGAESGLLCADCALTTPVAMVGELAVKRKEERRAKDQPEDQPDARTAG